MLSLEEIRKRVNLESLYEHIREVVDIPDLEIWSTFAGSFIDRT